MNLKKYLGSLTLALAVTVPVSLSTVACNNNSGKSITQKTWSDLQDKAFTVKSGSFTNDDSEVKQNQWGQNSIGALYASLWAINNDPANKEKEYPLINKEIASYLTNGEYIKRLPADDGSDVTLNGKKMTDVAKEEKLDDWHKKVLIGNDKIEFTLTIVTYEKIDGNLKPTEHNNIKLTINIDDSGYTETLAKKLVNASEGSAERETAAKNYLNYKTAKLVLELNNTTVEVPKSEEGDEIVHSVSDFAVGEIFNSASVELLKYGIKSDDPLTDKTKSSYSPNLVLEETKVVGIITVTWASLDGFTTDFNLSIKYTTEKK